jgi:hypothetical protein
LAQILGEAPRDDPEGAQQSGQPKSLEQTEPFALPNR